MWSIFICIIIQTHSHIFISLNLIFSSYRLSNSSFTDLQYFAAQRRAAAIAAVAAVALPPPPPTSTNQQGSAATGSAGITSQPIGSGPPPPPHDFHPAYRIPPGYMEHLYSLQHAVATASPGASSLHGKYNINKNGYTYQC